jgi:hypothetical protein
LEKLTNEVLLQYLTNGDGAVDIGDAAVLRLRRLTVHVVLLDVVCNMRSLNVINNNIIIKLIVKFSSFYFT